MKKKYLFLLCGIVVAFLLLGMVFCFSRHPVALTVKSKVCPQLLRVFHRIDRAELQGLGKDFSAQLYLNGSEAEPWSYDPNGDLKRVYRTQDRTRLVNYSSGYQMDFPADARLDFSMSESVVELRGEGYEFTVSREYCPYDNVHPEMTEGLARLAPQFEYETGMDQYIGYYQSRFLLNEGWQKNNRVTVTQPEIIEAAGCKAYLFHAVIQEMTAEHFDAYSYLYICMDEKEFLRVVVKYNKEDQTIKEFLPTLTASYRALPRRGVPKNGTNFTLRLPEEWNEETRRVYDNIANGPLRWGIYTTDVAGEGIERKIPELEQKLDYRFPVVLGYVHSIENFPLAFMEKNWEQGRLVELTYQLTENNNTDMFGFSPALELYRGGYQETVRRFARQAKEFGHPFLFRFCNEANSDWTSYGGVVNMADPDIFAENWRTVYRIFQEEGVQNCIWIYNPNDRNAPPNRWNDSVTYYPGDEYVQMIGVTGYNNGTYYKQWAEEWREFDVIYDHIDALYRGIYGDFPWIITEFSSSSVGGDKAKWIQNMFGHIGKYPNIKIAVWFSSADWDAEGNVARPYWLDETPETTAAFKEGLKDWSDSPILGNAE